MPAAQKKPSKRTSPFVVAFVVVAVGVAAVAVAAVSWALPAVREASAARAELADEQERTAQARSDAERFSATDELDELVRQVRVADRILPQRTGSAVVDDLRLELPRSIDAAAQAVGGSFDADGFAVDTVPLLGVPLGLGSARTVFSVTLTDEAYPAFLAALEGEGILLTTSSATVSATAGSDGLRPGAPADFEVTGLVWWSTTGPANLGSLGG